MSNIHFVDGNTKAHLLIVNALVISEGLCDRNGRPHTGWRDREERAFEECEGEIQFEVFMCKAKA